MPFECFKKYSHPGFLDVDMLVVSIAAQNDSYVDLVVYYLNKKTGLTHHEDADNVRIHSSQWSKWTRCV